MLMKSATRLDSSLELMRFLPKSAGALTRSESITNWGESQNHVHICLQAYLQMRTATKYWNKSTHKTEQVQNSAEFFKTKKAKIPKIEVQGKMQLLQNLFKTKTL